MAIQLIVSDVDGTLIDQTETTGKPFVQLAEMIQVGNLPFTIASGRCYRELESFKKQLHISLPIVFNNGAAASNGSQMLWQYSLDPMQLKPAIQKADELDMVIVISDGEGETAYRHNDYIQNQINKFGRYNRFYIPLEHEWPHLNIQKVLFIDPQKEGRVDEALALLKPYTQELNIVRYNARSVDIMAKQSTKANGVAQLAAALGIPMQDVLAIGDSLNDAEMLQEVGVGVAVANADDRLKSHADYVCKNNDILGVIEAIEQFVPGCERKRGVCHANKK